MSTASDVTVARYLSRGGSLPLDFFETPPCEVSSAAEDVLFVGALAAADMSRSDRVRARKITWRPKRGSDPNIRAATQNAIEYGRVTVPRPSVFPRLGGHEVEGFRYKGAYGNVGRNTSSTETQEKKRIILTTAKLSSESQGPSPNKVQHTCRERALPGNSVPIPLPTTPTA